MAAPQQSGSQGDNSTGLLWGTAGIFAVLAVIWYAFKNYIVIGFLTLKLYEADLLVMISPERFSQLQMALTNAISNPSTVVFNDLLTLGSGVGDWLRIPIVIILFILAIVVYFSNAARAFTHTYSMRDFATFEKSN